VLQHNQLPLGNLFRSINYIINYLIALEKYFKLEPDKFRYKLVFVGYVYNIVTQKVNMKLQLLSRDTNIKPSASTEDKDEWSSTSTSPYLFVEWSSMKYREHCNA
jgi:hypothetical protein